MDETEVEKHFVPRALPLKEYLAPGHRACQGCGPALAFRHILKALGPNTVISEATGCGEIISTPYPQTAWRVPWIHTAFENAASVASGIEAAYKILMRKGRIPEERITVVALAGDGGTGDIGVQALSGAMERGHDFIYICYDNEAYMNTGIQRSGLTPFGAATTTSPAGSVVKGQTTWKKDMPSIAAAHHIPYVATACTSYPADLYAKVMKAAEVRGPAYLHILAPCPTGWRCPSDMTIEIGRRAVESGLFNLFEIVDGKKKLTLEVPKRRPVADYLKPQGRFRHLDDEDIAFIQRKVDEDYEALLAEVSG
ncbi:MAG: pyruvate synthase subunit PorB [Actinomycetota bacterium]|nr:pyruvate synthase subunit PorB [Actinomycetota bacterium]